MVANNEVIFTKLLPPLSWAGDMIEIYCSSLRSLPSKHKQHFLTGVRKSQGTTSVVTQNCSPAPSQSEAVMMGLATHTKPCSLKN